MARGWRRAWAFATGRATMQRARVVRRRRRAMCTTRRYPSRPLAWEDARRVILAHAIDGPDDGPPLVLVGSLGTEKSMWRPQVSGLAGPLRLVRLDVRGHGDSPVPDGPYTIEALARDVLDTMDALGL